VSPFASASAFRSAITRARAGSGIGIFDRRGRGRLDRPGRHREIDDVVIDARNDGLSIDED
jgi:hypothetical protein